MPAAAHSTFLLVGWLSIRAETKGMCPMKRVMIALVPTIALVLSLATSSASACPITIPEPANATDCACFAVVTAGRCGAGISPTICVGMQNSAYALGRTVAGNELLTDDGYQWLRANNYCPIHADYGAGDHIYSICPMG